MIMRMTSIHFHPSIVIQWYVYLGRRYGRSTWHERRLLQIVSECLRKVECPVRRFGVGWLVQYGRIKVAFALIPTAFSVGKPTRCPYHWLIEPLAAWKRAVEMENWARGGGGAPGERMVGERRLVRAGRVDRPEASSAMCPDLAYHQNAERKAFPGSAHPWYLVTVHSHCSLPSAVISPGRGHCLPSRLQLSSCSHHLLSLHPCIFCPLASYLGNLSLAFN